MNLDNINNQQSYTTKLQITETSFIHILPDINIDIGDVINTLNIGLNNCNSIYIKTSPLRLGNHSINSKFYFYKMKQKREEEKYSFNLVQSLPSKLGEHKYIIIDHSILSQGIAQLHEVMPNKKTLTTLLFSKLKEDFLTLKSKYPTVKQVLIFNLTSNDKDTFNLFSLIQNFKLFQDDSSIFQVFDSHCLVAVTANPGHTTYIPLLSFDKKGQVELLTSNISKINSALSLIKPKEAILVDTLTPVINPNANPEVEPTTPVEAIVSPESIAIKASLAKNVVKTLVNQSEKTPDNNFFQAINEIDKSKLSKVLRGYNVKDAVVANNIKTVVDEYVRLNPDELKKTDLEHLILKAVNFSIFNTDEIKQEYIDDPSKLIAKLSEINTYFKQVTYPEPINPQLMSPNDMIDINKITGPVRHEYEYGPNIDFVVESLFRSLETRKTSPIQIVNFKSEIKDNNMDRIKEYTINVRNLTGDLKEPYELKLKIPALINNRYFKLNGQSYIPTNQQYLNPITKDKNNEARFLSHFNMVTLSTVNTKFNSSQIQDILNYIKIKYPQLIIESKADDSNNINYIEFKNGTIVDLNSNTPFKSDKHEILLDDGEFKLRDIDLDEILNLHIPKNEYIFNELISLIHTVDPGEELNRTAKVNPYIQIHVMGRRMPYIVFMWQQLGLIEAITKFGINFEIAQKPSSLTKKPSIEFPLEEGSHLFIYPDTKRQELICNGLLLIPKKKFSFSASDLSNRESVFEFIDSQYGAKSSFRLDQAMENMIDPITKELLEFEDLPTNFIDITSGPLLDKLLNDKSDHPADLKNLRLRQAEVLMNLLYTELCMAYNRYNSELKAGNTNVKLYFHPDYVIWNLLGQHSHSDASGGSLMDYSETFSPVDELVKASKCIKTGPGGIPSQRAFRKEHRAIHPSYYGNLSAHSTSEYATVGTVNSLTLGASISNTFGNFGGKRTNQTKYNTDSLGIDEYLTPFVGHMDSDRLIIARTHVGQKVSIDNAEPALVETGAEYLVPQLTSTKFAHISKERGIVTGKSDNEYITVQYKSGKIETLDTMPRYTATKRNSTIQIPLKTLQIGDRFQKGQMLAWAKSFNGDSLTIGRNCVLAIMNYRGFNFEDAYCISEDMANKFVTDNVIKKSIIIPLNTKVINIISKINTESDTSTPLIEFQYLQNIETYLNMYELNDDETEDDSNDSALFTKTATTLKRMSPGGEIVDIRIKLNTKQNIDPMIVSLWEAQKARIIKLQKILTTNKNDKLTDNIDTSVLTVGGHKTKSRFFEGALIEFYIKQPKGIEIGDKVSNRFGAKGIVSRIIPKSMTPRAEYSNNVDIFIQPTSLLSRKNTCILKELYIGKIIHYLPKIISTKLKANESIADIKKLILEVYEILDPTKDQDILHSIVKKFTLITDKILKDSLINEVIRFNYMIPPFNAPDFNAIKQAAKILEIPLNERVYIPETKTWTKNEVPVGYSYYSAMEQLSADYESTRSSAGYVSFTGQPTVNYLAAL